MCYKNNKLLGFEAEHFFCSLYHVFAFIDGCQPFVEGDSSKYGEEEESIEGGQLKTCWSGLLNS
jgi:hypothetical protein